MLKEERQHLILDMLRKNGKVLASELSQYFEVSEDTIRRDLRELDEAGQMVRVHGGGLPHSPAIISFTERLNQSPAAKTAIARAAVKHIRPGQTIILDGGTTNLQVARNLPQDLHATIIKSRVTTGISTVEAFHAIRADVCFLGICSLHPDVGISTDCYEESFVKQAMIHGSSEVLALAAVEKLGTASQYIVAPITSLTHLITELEVPEALILPYLEAGIQVEQV